MRGLPFFEYIREYFDDLIFYTQQHAILSLYVVATAAIIGIIISLVSYRNAVVSQLAIGASSIAFTLPSIALLGLMVPLLGLGLASVFPVLILYAVLPVIRNTIAGLQNVDGSILEAAKGTGMSRWTILFRVELPLAWPVILTGIRVATQITVGLVAIAAYVKAPGLGRYPLDALYNLGSVNTFNEALIGTMLIAALGLVFDGAFVLIRRFATPKGIRE